jgi:hypothetical protein
MEMQARFPRIFVGYGRTGFLAKKVKIDLTVILFFR